LDGSGRNKLEGCDRMGSKKETEIDFNHLAPEDSLKYEIAKELGYLDKVMTSGWKSLTSKESGRIGGMMNRKKKELQKQNDAKEE